MNFQRWALPLGSLLLMAASLRVYGWGGLAAALGAVLMGLLLDFTRTMKVLRLAGSRPAGCVDSAVMFNARLRKGTPLVRVLAQTRSLGIAQTAQGVEPEVFRWTDAAGSYVDCSFRHGRLVAWQLCRP